VIIDDGLHRMGSVLATFNNLWPLLSPTGIYLLEDIHRNVDLHQHVWKMPFRSMDPNIVDPASLNALQVRISKIKLICYFNLLQRFEDSSKDEALWAIYPPLSIAPEISLSILSVTDCCAWHTKIHRVAAQVLAHIPVNAKTGSPILSTLHLEGCWRGLLMRIGSLRLKRLKQKSVDW